MMDFNRVATELNKEHFQVPSAKALNEYYMSKDVDNYEATGLDQVPRRDLMNEWLKNEYYPKYMPKFKSKDNKETDVFKYYGDARTWAEGLEYGDKKLDLQGMSGMMDYRPGMEELEPKAQEIDYEQLNNRFPLKPILEELDTSRWGGPNVVVPNKYFIYQKRAVVNGFPDKTISSRLPFV